MLILDRDSIGINNSYQKEPTSMYVIEKILMDTLSMKRAINKSVEHFQHHRNLFYIQSARV